MTVSLETNPTTFRGKERRTENGTGYWQGNSGVKAGAVLAALPAIGAVIDQVEISSAKKLIKETEKDGAKKEIILKGLNKHRYTAIATSLFAIASYIGCGAIVDNIRNKNAKKAAENIDKYGLENAIYASDNLRLSYANTPYYKSDDGAKYGALLGMGYGLAAMGLAFALRPKEINKLFKHIEKETGIKNLKLATGAATLLLTLPVSALGGWIMGKIADKNNNEAAEKASVRRAARYF